MTRRRTGLLAALALAGPGVAWAEEAGRGLFHEGTGAEAIISGGDARVPASVFPCANCHGVDGLGAQEGGVAALPITWSQLSVPTASRPAYDYDAFVAALTRGFSVGGWPLNAAMPRYRMDPATLDALTSYLQVLESEQQAGIGPDHLDLMGPADPEARLGFEAALHDIQGFGRIHGRVLREGRPAALDLSEPFRVLDAATLEAETDALLDAAAKDGVRDVRLLSEDPDIRQRLDMAGLAPDSSSAATLLIHPLLPDTMPQIGLGPLYVRWAALDASLLAMVAATPGLELVVTDPFPASTAWAREAGLGRSAAAGHAATLMAGEALVQAGRRLSRARITAALTEAGAGEVAIRRFAVPGSLD